MQLETDPIVILRETLEKNLKLMDERIGMFNPFQNSLDDLRVLHVQRDTFKKVLHAIGMAVKEANENYEKKINEGFED